MVTMACGVVVAQRTVPLKDTSIILL